MKTKQIRNTVIMVVLSIALVFGISALTKKQPVNYNDGTYYAVSEGNSDGLWVKVEIADNAILSVEVVEHKESTGICEPAIEQIPANIVENQSYAVSVVSGATKTSNGIKNAVQNALEQAAGKAEIVSYTPPAPKEDPKPLGYTYNAGTYTLKEAVECWSADVYEWAADVTVVLDETGIASVTLSNMVGDQIGYVNDNLPAKMVQFQTYDVDIVNGATFSSKGLIESVKQIVESNKR